MGVQNLSVAQDHYTQEGTIWGLLIREGQDDSYGPRDIRLVWSTEYGSDPNKEWVIEMSVRGRFKGHQIFTDWRDFAETFPASECHETKPYGDNGRTWWSHDFQVANFMQWGAGATREWVYSRRYYDTLDFEVAVHSNWGQKYDWSDQTGSDTARLSFSLSYCPEYVLTGAYYEPGDLFVVEYQTSWDRTDDRFNFRDTTAPSSTVSTVDGKPLLTGQYYGVIASRGRIEVPGSMLTEHVVGKQVNLWIDFNAEWRPISLEFNHGAGTFTVQDRRACSTPRIALVSSGETIRISTASLHDEDVEPETVTVKMVGSYYSSDQVSVPLGAVAEFRYPPLGKRLEFEAVGYSADGAVSKVSNRVVVEPISGSSDILIDPVSGGDRVKLRLRTEWDAMGPTIDASPEVTTVQLEGRRSPSSFYGSGVSKNVSFTAALIGDDGSAVENLATVGDVMVRFPDGRRYCIAPEVKVNRRTSEFVDVTVSGVEVGG